jgi:hypothetical protein
MPQSRSVQLFLSSPPSPPARAGKEDHTIAMQNTEISAIRLRSMRANLDEAAAVAQAAEGSAVDSQAAGGRGLSNAAGEPSVQQICRSPCTSDGGCPHPDASGQH